MKENNYVLLRKTQKKDTSGHYLYEFQCKTCNKIKLKRKGFFSTICNHNHYIHKKLNNEEKINRIYNIYASMKDRCYNKNNKSYKNYGGKNIKICEEWLKNYYLFQKWSLENGYEESLTIDRINPNGNYEPNNCRWITLEENSRFKSTTNYITIYGITKSGNQWSTYLGKGKNYINVMLRKNGIDYTTNYIKKNI